MLTLYRRLAVLDQLYQLYDNYIDTLDIACKKFCADCCTGNVTITTLEAQKIISALDMNFKTQMQRRSAGRCNSRGLFRRHHQSAGEYLRCWCTIRCPKKPLIRPGTLSAVDGQCLPHLHPGRSGAGIWYPLSDARVLGAAEIDDFTLTVNHAFLQYIEHIDQNGGSGNLLDVLCYAIHNESANTRDQIRPRTTLIRNTPLSASIPPEHREQIAPIMAAIHR
ncbi:MAG: hypothetical protein R2860_12385 [Desulfobacterales bacterium]